jgi:hypothetical protein
MASGKCYHHPSQNAVVQCRGCGKGICKDCFNVYGVDIGEYAGQALCYDCTEVLVTENITNITAFKERVKKERMWMIVGAVIGAAIAIFMNSVVGYFSGGLLFLGIVIGASFGTIHYLYERWGVVIGTIALIICPIMSIYRFVKRINQIKEADEIVTSDTRTLQEMKDYFAYTQAIEKNKGISLAKLAEQGSELYDNAYVKAVLDKGEKEAQAELRQSVVAISANGEIIRSFDKQKGKSN